MEISNQFLDINSIKPNSYSNVENKNLKDDKSLKDVCDNFEAFFMNQILATSLKSSNIAGEGTGSDIIKGMYTDALSQKSSGSLGISDMLFKFLSEKKS
jgi:Rod binding domain-containing protein